jgi:hypothetical protein
MPRNVNGPAPSSSSCCLECLPGPRTWRRFAVPLALVGTLAAARAEVSCPDQLSVQQRAEAPSGWSVSYADAPPRLTGVTLFDGPPSNRVSLKYTRRRQTGKELILSWILSDSPRSHYLLCSYERTTAQINTALPPGTRRCDVVFDRTTSYPGGGLPVKRMFCQ